MGVGNTNNQVSPELEEISKFEIMASLEHSDSEIFNYYRLVILCGLYREKIVSFPLLKELTNINSAGNLSSHLRALENLDLIKYHKGEAGRRTLAFYSITDKGRQEVKNTMAKLKIVLDVLNYEG